MESGLASFLETYIRPDAPPGFKGPGTALAVPRQMRRLYVAGLLWPKHDVMVLGPEGSVVGRIETTGNLPTNCIALALPGSRRIAVTEDEFGQLEMYDHVPDDGLPLWH